jgi:hypothetical protein
MAENIVTPAIPPGAIAIVVSTNGAATLYTAVAKRRLHITGLAITIDGTQSAAGQADINVTPENGTAGSALRLQAGIGKQNSVSIEPLDLPTVSNVTTTITGAFTGGTASFTLVGWEETTFPS